MERVSAEALGQTKLAFDDLVNQLHVVREAHTKEPLGSSETI